MTRATSTLAAFGVVGEAQTVDVLEDTNPKIHQHRLGHIDKRIRATRLAAATSSTTASAAMLTVHT